MSKSLQSAAVALLTCYVLSSFSSTAQAADCGQLTILNRLTMLSPSHELQAFVPVTVNGTTTLFMVDTGGITTSVPSDLVAQFKLPRRQGNTEFYNATGAISRDVAIVNNFSIGTMHGTDKEFPIISGYPQLSLNFMVGYDIDFDFSSNTMNFFSQDHCPGAVVYWKSAATGVVPITLRDGHMIVPVKLDGQEFDAIIDTGAAYSTLRMDIAQHSYGLTMGSQDTPEAGTLNGDATLKTYHHHFISLTIGDIAVKNPNITIIPDAMNRNGSTDQTTESRARLERDNIHVPEIIIGMDVLRKLHVYMAFGERKLYVSADTPPAAPLAATPTH